MKILVDTHALIWAGTGDRRLSKRAALALDDPENDLFVSVVTYWEITVKQRRHPAFVLVEPLRSTMERYGLQPLGLDFDVPEKLKSMPGIHGDPFDRILVAQALHHGFVLMTGDKAIRRYPVETIW